jgi:hypothetical protein
MKDFYDVWLLSRSHAFASDRLARAIAATFARRNTPIPIETPDALAPAFADDPAKRQAWTSFARNIGSHAGSFAEVIHDLAAFLMPHTSSARRL